MDEGEQMNHLKEMFNEQRAYYDSVNDKIVGCKKGSLTWWHERRHQMQFKNLAKKNWLILLDMWITIFVAAMVSSYWLSILTRSDVYSGLLFVIMIALTPMTVMFWYSEIDAWVYAFRKCRK